jgi:hypothetical protein
LAPGSGLIAAACTALGLSRASLHRRQAFRGQPPAPVRPRPPPMRALVAKERQVVLDLLREPRFVDLAPAEVYASLLDQGLYLCSIRTMFRITSTNRCHQRNWDTCSKGVAKIMQRLSVDSGARTRANEVARAMRIETSNFGCL